MSTAFPDRPEGPQAPAINSPLRHTRSLAETRRGEGVNRPNESNPSSVLDVRDLSVSYRTTKAVDHVSFHIERGEIFGLLGPNGAGKTSTLSAIEGLLTPHSGSAVRRRRQHQPTARSGEVQDGRATPGDELPSPAQRQADRSTLRGSLRRGYVEPADKPGALNESDWDTKRSSSSSTCPVVNNSDSRSSSPSSTIQYSCCSTSPLPVLIPNRAASSGHAWSSCGTRVAASC